MKINEINNSKVFFPPRPSSRCKSANRFKFCFSTDVIRQAITIGYIHIKEEYVILAVDETNADSTAGSDALPAVLFKKLLQLLLRASLQVVSSQGM